MKNKNCNICNKLKTPDCFRPKRNRCRDCENTKNREYRKNNLEKVRKIKKEWRENNKEKENNRTIKWRENNKNNKDVISKMKLTRNEYLKNKRKTDMIFRMKEAMRRMVRRTVLRKTDSTSKTLGYSPSELKQHLEALFKDGMSWDNYGTWEIDHIKPIGSFDINTPANIINALSNLQPLWRLDNNLKSNKF